MSSVTTVDQFPPPEIRSVTKYQTAKTVTSEMKGKRKRRVSSMHAAMTRSTNERRATENPWNGELNELEWSQPNQTQSAPTNTAHASTDANAKTPAAIHRSRTRNPCAIAYSTAKTSSDQSTSAPSP